MKPKRTHEVKFGKRVGTYANTKQDGNLIGKEIIRSQSIIFPSSFWNYLFESFSSCENDFQFEFEFWPRSLILTGVTKQTPVAARSPNIGMVVCRVET